MIFNKLFARYLIDEAIISADIIDENLELAEASSTPIHVQLTKNSVVDEEKVYQALASFLGFEYRYCQLAEIDLDFVKKYPRDLLLEYQGVPFSLNGDVLTILGSNPFRIEEFHELLHQGGKKIEFIISPPQQMKRILDYANNKIQQDEVMNEYIKIVKEKIGITDKEFNEIMAAPSHSHDEYKTENDTIQYKAFIAARNAVLRLKK